MTLRRRFTSKWNQSARSRSRGERIFVSSEGKRGHVQAVSPDMDLIVRQRVLWIKLVPSGCTGIHYEF